MTEYTMPEIVWIIERWSRKEAQAQLMTLNLQSLPHWKDEDEKQEFHENLKLKAYGYLPEDDEGDLEGLRNFRERVGGKI